MRTLKFALKSLGCKVSQYDGERLAEKLQILGLKPDEEQPDIFILNGCSVTGRASQKVRQTLRAARKRWPEVKIVLAGCEARLRQQREEESLEADYALPFFDEFSAVLAMVQHLFADFVYDPHRAASEDQILTAKTRAFLKIQDGCNQFCSYCIVSHLRGQEWSRPIDEAVEEARRLAAEGHKEIVLTGIHLGHFRPSLLDLLQQLEKIPELARIRLSSIEPIEVDENLINWVASSEKACPHFHLPLQSGSDTILKKMRRPYSTEDFRRVVERIRKQMPLAAITTDLIVGFPGETDDLFAETLKFIEELQFSRIHIFKFSPRDGTPAATMPDQIGNQVKSMRSDEVEKVWHQSAAAFYRSFVGKRIEVLWETFEENSLHGFSREYVPCFCDGKSGILVNSVAMATGISSDFKGLKVSFD
ncbi:MAG: tRNA (N(6)-L-threonylcarbamoyladenosine(37)-C(2))-methylthiotransferase MtaB [Candidatus Rifleibacteriota bacterium]